MKLHIIILLAVAFLFFACNTTSTKEEVEEEIIPFETVTVKNKLEAEDIFITGVMEYEAAQHLDLPEEVVLDEITDGIRLQYGESHTFSAEEITDYPPGTGVSAIVYSIYPLESETANIIGKGTYSVVHRNGDSPNLHPVITIKVYTVPD